MLAAARAHSASASNLLEKLPLTQASVVVAEVPWLLTLARNQDALVDAVDDLEHLPYGFLVWESAIGLARYIASRAPEFAGQSVLELGCGVGLPGMVAQSCGAMVTQTDHQPGVLTLARMNAEENGVQGIEYTVADWRNWNVRRKFDMIIGADILYERDMHFHLEQVIDNSLKPGGRLLVADPGRTQALEFLAALEKRSWRMDMHTFPVRLDFEGPESRAVDVAIVEASRRS